MLLLKILNRIDPNLIWALYAKRCKKVLDRSYFILSFDCDTEEDISVVWDVHSKLQDIGITPVYAVPGALLKKGHKVYKRIQKTGAEFINHGGREHTYFDKTLSRHASCFFYDQESYSTVKEDIFLGHKILKDVLGVTANGWRTPHFGTFQKPEDLEFLCSVLKELDYKFSTSTSPQMAYQYDPIYKTHSLIEIPVTGIFSEPFNIMDTWAYFGAPDRVKTPEDYLVDVNSIKKLASETPLLINIYGDPSHIHDQPKFFQAMKNLVDITPNVSYSHLLKDTYGKIRSLR